MVAASQPTAQRNWGLRGSGGGSMSLGAAGRGDRGDLGASCPSVSMVPGAGDYSTGDTRRRDPVWETALPLVAPAPAAPLDIPYPFLVEAVMTPRKDNFPHPGPRPRRRRVTLPVTN